LISLDPDVARVFRDSEAVNAALRGLIELAAQVPARAAAPREAAAVRPARAPAPAAAPAEATPEGARFEDDFDE
jgi:hypothetical protein